jgi:hypothetical protein
MIAALDLVVATTCCLASEILWEAHSTPTYETIFWLLWFTFFRENKLLKGFLPGEINISLGPLMASQTN